MSSFQEKKKAALQALESTGISRSNYLPPALKLLWRLGFRSPPPHFAHPAWIVVVAGTYFAVAWGLLMYFANAFLSEGQTPLFRSLLLTSIAAGAFFGIAMAAYYAYGRRKHQLPAWDSLP